MSTVDAEKQKLAGKISLLLVEIERLSKVIVDKQEEIKSLNLVILDKDRSIARIPALEDRNTVLTNDNTRLNQQIRIITEETIRKLTDENLQLRQQLSQNVNFENVRNELNVKIGQLSQENDRLNLIITTLSSEKLKLQA